MDPTKQQLEQLGALVARYHEQAALVAQAEVQLKEAKATLRVTEEADIPSLMDECGLLTITASDGSSVKVADVLTANIPKARRMVAAEWLEDNGLGELISDTIILKFKRDERERAAKLLQHLVNEDYHVDAVTEFNTASLKAAIRERLREGKPIDFELLGIHNVRKAIVKEPQHG